MKKNKILLLLSLISTVGITGSSYTSNLTKTDTTNNIIRKKGKLNSENKTKSLNAVGEIALETLEQYIDASNYSIERIMEIRDFGDNSYVLVEFNPIGYLIYNVSNGDVVECAPLSQSPYLKTKSQNLLYLPMVGYFSNISGKYTNLMDNKEVNEKQFESYKKEARRYHNKALSKINEDNVNRTKKGSDKEVVRRRKNTVISYDPYTMIYANTEVPSSWYFKKCEVEYAAAGDGSCGYIAAGLLLSYMEIFRSTGYFSSYQAQRYITEYNGSIFYTGVPRVDDDFLYELDSNLGGATLYELECAINSFMSGKNKSYTIKKSSGIFTNVKKPVKDGFPTIYAGNIEDFYGGSGSHGVVVYGIYDNGNVLCHYGWAGYTQVVMSTLGLFSESGALSIYNNSNHVHNTYFILNGQTHCGCGDLITC